MNSEKLSILSVVFLAVGWALMARHIIFSILMLPITKKISFREWVLKWTCQFYHGKEKKRKDSSFTIMGMLSLGL